ncbi:Dead-box atp-dependent RNA helicase 42, partial [Globisporangium splendens]
MGGSSRRSSEKNSSRKRRRSRSRSRSASPGASRSKHHASSSSRDDRKKSRRRRRSRSVSSDDSDRRSRSRSPRSRSRDRGGRRSSRGDASERRYSSSSKKDRRHRSRSRSASRHRSSSKKEKKKSSRHRRHSSRSRSDSRSGDERKKKASALESTKIKDSSATDAAKDTIVDHKDQEAPAAVAAPALVPPIAVAADIGSANAASSANHKAKTQASSSVKSPEKDTKRGARSRSRSRDSKRRRSRSRSRGRARKLSSDEKANNKISKGSTPATGTLQKFKFGGIALKTDKLKAGLKAPLRKSSLNGAGRAPALSAEDEKQKRREKLKLWREQQLKLKEEETQKFLAEEDAVPKQLTLWSLEEEEKKETPEERQKREEEEEMQRQRVQKVVEEVDPLDAYMAGLVDEAAIQQSIANPASNVISLDEIEAKPKINIYGTFLPQIDAEAATDDANDDEPSASDPDVLSETAEEKEAREERELQEFMRAIKEQREKEASDSNGAPRTDDGTSTDKSASEQEDGKKVDTGRIYQGFEEDIIGEEAGNIDQRSALEILQEAQKKKEIKAVDHSQIEYIPFQKKFYVVPKEIKDMSEAEVEAMRNEDEIKIRGKNCPRPLRKWTQCGFSVRMLQLIQKHGYTEPFAIQRQALPAIMSGRDVIGIAKTGSGKTLAFLLPMFRHILYQPPLQEGEGPIGLIMAPARELVQQIYLEAKKFAKGLGMRATAVYGGSSVSEQIGNLKRGSDIVICTPGRMIDILTMSAGKMVSLQRVTYVVLDEADRMFDMGFEPQITKIMMNIRADRQTLLFSATFPRAVETLARRVLKKPVEITVGGRSTASGDITQYVEVREENDKFMRLLQLLGLWYEKGNVLVFVNTQQACDQVFQDLMKAGYPALSLHGALSLRGKDQVDRDYTIDDFKRKVRTLMVATSVAGRGLDVKDLVLVINYHCPNHLEDYVHRVGRTGRAGRKGTAYTFISPDEEEYSVDLVKALEAAKQAVPPELSQLAKGFKGKVERGEARFHGSGFKGKGYTFDENERNEAQRAMDLQKRQYEIDQGIFVEDGAGDDDDTDDAGPKDSAATGSASAATSAAPATANSKVPIDSEALSAVKKAQQIAQILDMQYKQTQANAAAGTSENHFEEELEINDYPQQARWKVTQKEASDSVAELTGAAVIARGSYVPAGRKPNPGERKLYLAIEGPTRASVVDARRELQRILDETTLQVGLGGDKYGKYNLNDPAATHTHIVRVVVGKKHNEGGVVSE